jgi:hypothetical protein
VEIAASFGLLEKRNEFHYFRNENWYFSQGISQSLR